MRGAPKRSSRTELPYAMRRNVVGPMIRPNFGRSLVGIGVVTLNAMWYIYLRERRILNSTRSATSSVIILAYSYARLSLSFYGKASFNDNVYRGNGGAVSNYNGSMA